MVQLVKHLPSVENIISGSWDRAPLSGSLPSRESASPSPSAPPPCLCSFFLPLSRNKGIFLRFYFIYLREREHKQGGGGEGGGEADSMLSRGPDAGLHPRTLRS